MKLGRNTQDYDDEEVEELVIGKPKQKKTAMAEPEKPRQTEDDILSVIIPDSPRLSMAVLGCLVLVSIVVVSWAMGALTPAQRGGMVPAKAPSPSPPPAGSVPLARSEKPATPAATPSADSLGKGATAVDTGGSIATPVAPAAAPAPADALETSPTPAATEAKGENEIGDATKDDEGGDTGKAVAKDAPAPAPATTPEAGAADVPAVTAAETLDAPTTPAAQASPASEASPASDTASEAVPPPAAGSEAVPAPDAATAAVPAPPATP